MKADLPCAVCNKELETVDNDLPYPYEANIFSSTGHYGATAFDAFGREHIEIYICTECLEQMREDGKVNLVKTIHQPSKNVKETWK